VDKSEWGVRGEGNERLTHITATQTEAIDLARISPSISKANYLFTTGWVKSGSATATATILIRRGAENPANWERNNL
jgi:hypothetical protein